MMVGAALVTALAVSGCGDPSLCALRTRQYNTDLQNINECAQIPNCRVESDDIRVKNIHKRSMENHCDMEKKDANR